MMELNGLSGHGSGFSLAEWVPADTNGLTDRCHREPKQGTCP